MYTSIYIAQSLDGFIADKNNNLDWLSDIPNQENNDFGFAEFMGKIDAVVMGRNTFEKVVSFKVWPYTKPVFVISQTLKDVPKNMKQKAEILYAKPSEILQKLNKNGYRRLYIDGGALIQSFLCEDLIDELIITTIPILLGGGFPLFGELKDPLKFTLVKTEVLLHLMVKNSYKRSR